MIRNQKVQILAVSGLLLAWNASAFADPTSDARKTITAIYQKQTTALGRKDVAAALGDKTPDFVDIDLKGRKSTAAADRQRATPIVSASKSVHATATITHLSLKNNLALVTVKEKLTLMIPNPKTQKTITFIENSVSKDTWVKTKSGWLEKRSLTISDSTTADGKPLPQP